MPERDVALGGSGLMVLTGTMPRDEAGLLDALRNGYTRMRDVEGPVPSPVIGTFLWGHEPEDHSVLRVTRTPDEQSESVVVFLHGYMGSVTLLCWQVAQAAMPLDIDVVCPATGWEADWVARAGRATIQETIAALRRRGAQRIYLAGLSAGAAGASRLAPRLDVDALILISGSSPGATAPNIPVLVLQGRRDRMMPAELSRDYAAEAGGEYLEHPEAGHWLLLTHHRWVTRRLTAWLRSQEERAQLERR